MRACREPFLLLNEQLKGQDLDNAGICYLRGIDLLMITMNCDSHLRLIFAFSSISEGWPEPGQLRTHIGRAFAY